jgi:DNA-3-methyladenine glycosylase I
MVVPDPALRPVAGADGVRRCPWGASTPDYVAYHDQEWGRPLRGDSAFYERLCLEGFQSGLSWLTILRKREGFRRAFAAFDPHVVAEFGEADVQRLLADPGIVRHRGKIEATVANARALVALQDERGEGALEALLREAAPTEASLRAQGLRRPPRTLSDLPARTAESAALARSLKRSGWRFLGPTTLYAAMQATGLVDDHLVGCDARGVDGA